MTSCVFRSLLFHQCLTSKSSVNAIFLERSAAGLVSPFSLLSLFFLPLLFRLFPLEGPHPTTGPVSFTEPPLVRLKPPPSSPFPKLMGIDFPFFLLPRIQSFYGPVPFLTVPCACLSPPCVTFSQGPPFRRLPPWDKACSSMFFNPLIFFFLWHTFFFSHILFCSRLAEKFVVWGIFCEQTLRKMPWSYSHS